MSYALGNSEQFYWDNQPMINQIATNILFSQT